MDALQKRRTEKTLISRMLDLDEPCMTEKVILAHQLHLGELSKPTVTTSGLPLTLLYPQARSNVFQITLSCFN